MNKKKQKKTTAESSKKTTAESSKKTTLRTSKTTMGKITKNHSSTTKSQQRSRKSKNDGADVKKSFLGNLFRRKSTKIYAIAVERSGRTSYIRFRSIMTDSGKIDYVPEFVTRFEESTKYISSDSAREHLIEIVDRYGIENAKIVEKQNR